MQILSKSNLSFHKIIKILILLLFIINSSIIYCQDTRVNALKTEDTTQLVKIGVYGDTRNNPQIHKKIVDKIIAEKPHAVFFEGDFVNDGREGAAWAEIHYITQPLRKITRYYPIAGNHEHESPYYYNEFKHEIGDKKWQSVDVGYAHFILLDSNLDLSPSSQQYKWFENELINAPKNRFLIVMMHHPMFSVGLYDQKIEEIKRELLALIERYKVDVVISGHVHSYQRFKKNDVIHLIIAGGGAPLYPRVMESPDNQYLQKFAKVYNYGIIMVSPHQFKVNIYSIDDRDKVELLDTFVLEK